MTNTVEIILEGRVVCGHPLRRNGVTKDDPATGRPVPVMDPATGLQKTEAYLAVAIPKNGSTDWKQTPWGQQIAAKGAQDWPNGEHGAATFAWKIVDGDSTVPNRVGKIPTQREGWPGHWVVHLSTMFAIQCYNVGNYDPLNQITDENAIKTGDYCRVAVGVKGNAPSQSPGVYLNPRLFELSRAGEPIISESGPSAAQVFGGVPAGNTPAPQAQTVAPAPDFLQGPQTVAPAPQAQTVAPAPQAQTVAPAPPPVKTYDVGGTQHTAEQLITAGWSQAQIDALGQ